MKTLFAFLLISCLSSSIYAQKVERPLIIFDTDMGPDYDDVGAIAILHALEANGECEILATVASDAHPDIAPTIEVFNTYFGRKDIPIGIAPSSAPNFTAGNNWNEKLIDKFQPEIKNKTYPDAVDVYRKVLSEQPDQSVTIVSVGFISNLAALLDSEPDDYSDLNGLELVEKKVKKWVAMAGSFPEGKEFNVFKDAPASYSTFQNWPTPILFSGFEIGSKIMTGNKVAKEKNINKACPIQWAYEYNLKTYAKKEVKNRASWDQTAVLCAVRNPSDYFYVNGPGAFLIEENGSNNWDPDTDNQHTFLVHKYPYQVIADEIESLMLYKPSMK